MQLQYDDYLDTDQVSTPPKVIKRPHTRGGSCHRKPAKVMGSELGYSQLAEVLIHRQLSLSTMLW